MDDNLTDPDTRCRLSPELPAQPVRLGRRNRLLLIIAENDNGEIEFTEYDPVTLALVCEDEAA